MKTFFISLIIIITLHAQDDRQAVIDRLYDYMDGTSKGQPDRLKDAFEENSALYAISGEGELMRRPSKGYIALFKEGQTNNRKGQIVYLDVVNDAASAIVEIAMGKRIYTDYILLLKIEGNWKIINKSYTYIEKEYKGKILFVVSNYSTYGDLDRRTGSHFGELVMMYDRFLTQGYEIDFVSPDGGPIPVSYINLNDKLQQHYFYDRKLNYKLKTSATPDQIKPAMYEAILYVGGSAVMFDIPNDERIQSLTKQIYEKQQGVVGAVCHGVAGLVNIKLENGNFLVDGKNVNSFTNSEENASGNGKYLPFMIETKLVERGGNFKSSANWAEHVEVSGRLVTGQNPASCIKLVDEMITLIEMN